jgi:broad specificity phosphatase PhoE
MANCNNINSPEYDKSGRAGMLYHTPVHRIVFVRHGETEANNKLMKNTNIDHITLDTCLTSTGLLQGEEVANFLKSIDFKPDNIFCSNLQRAYNTALPTITFVCEKFPDCVIELNQRWVECNRKKEEIIKGINNNPDWLYKRETNEQFIERVFSSFNMLKGIGSIDKPIQTIVFTHSQLIATVLSKCLTNTNSPSSESAGHFQLSNGSITCIDIDETGTPHVQTVNFTRHLSTPTGQHTPFV